MNTILPVNGDFADKGLSSSPPASLPPLPLSFLSEPLYCEMGLANCLHWAYGYLSGLVSDSLGFELWPLTWQALLCWPGPLLACGMCPHPLLLMVAQLSLPCGFLVLILPCAVGSTLGALKVLRLPEPIGLQIYTVLDSPLVSIRASSTGQTGTGKCSQMFWTYPARPFSLPTPCILTLSPVLRRHSLKGG